MLLWVTMAAAAELEAGAAVDCALGGTLEQSDVQTEAGWQVEGDLMLPPAPVGFRLEMDVDLAFSSEVNSVSATATRLVPEWMVVTAGTPTVWFAGGVHASEWGTEETDPWRNAMVTESMMSEELLPGGSILGASLGTGSDGATAWIIGGLEVPDGLNLVGEVGQDISTSVPLVGAGASWEAGLVEIAAGAFSRPFAGDPLRLDLGAELKLTGVWLTGEVAGDVRGSAGGLLQAQFLPRGPVSPVVRAESTSASGVGGSIGVVSSWAQVLRVKAEARYVREQPSVWLEAALYTKGMGER